MHVHTFINKEHVLEYYKDSSAASNLVTDFVPTDYCTFRAKEHTHSAVLQNLLSIENLYFNTKPLNPNSSHMKDNSGNSFETGDLDLER